jgi:predicted  nucleic acid-binding Zn-ribbon protein
MSDKQTLSDMVEDFQEENARLHEAIANLCNEMVVLESERDDLQRQLDRLTNNYKPAFLRDDAQ